MEGFYFALMKHRVRIHLASIFVPGPIDHHYAIRDPALRYYDCQRLLQVGRSTMGGNY